ncbi:MAG: transketolase [candidate division Zixibacteria bacterium]|nr:transketolase [candidate division Zixibacteria bacterium]
MTQQQLDQLCINTIRTLSMDAVQKANSGHPGTPMGMAGIGYALWTQRLKHNPGNPLWPDRDRFVLSMGHASMLLYSLLYLTGYKVTLDDIKDFRQWESITPGHPEAKLTPGVETTTGPLGQGFGNGVGMAIAEAFLAQQFNRPGHTIVDHHIYAFCSDGDIMEGVASEAASLAGHLKLNKLIYFYDQNQISIDGDTAKTFTEDVGKRFESYDWHVQHIDGMDHTQVGPAIERAQKETGKPSLIISPTHIGYPSPNKQDTASAHGSPLGEDEVRLTKEKLDWPADEQFRIPAEALVVFRECQERGNQWEREWNEKFDAYRKEHPELAAQFERQMKGELPDGWDRDLPEFDPNDDPLATRKAGKKILGTIAKTVPNLIGGSADLVSSTGTEFPDSGSFSADDRSGRNIHFGVREHAMGSLGNGMAAHGGIIPMGSTFLIFSDYQRPTIRLAALSHFQNIFVYTHDSVGLGEDGPTHQPIEHMASLRAIPNLVTLRPADPNETTYAWKVAMERTDGPTAMALTRQGVPILDRSRYAPAEGTLRGAYVLSDADEAKAIIIATGSEVSVALAAQDALAQETIPVRVVSMPSWELFAVQDPSYRDEVLPPSITARVSVEAASTFGWERWVGQYGKKVGIDRFGASAPGKMVLTELGINTDTVVQQVKSLL